MTKRIFAILLALVMSVSMFAIPVVAAGEIEVVQNGNDLVASWAPVAGASTYTVKVLKGTSVVSTYAVTTPSTKYTVTSSGNYQFAVEAIGTNGIVNYTSNVFAATYTNTTTAGGLTFTRTGSTVTISWAANASAASYNVTYSVAGVNKGTWNTTATSYTISGVADTATVSATVTYNTAAGQQNAGTIGSGASNGTTTTIPGTSTGSFTVSNGYIYWAYGLGTSTTQYIVSCYNAAGALLNHRTVTGSKSYPVSSLPTGTARVEIRVSTLTSAPIASGYVTASTVVGSGSVTLLSRTSTGATIAWTDLGASIYIIKCSVNSGSTVDFASTTESYTIPCALTDTVRITIYANDGVNAGKYVSATLTSTGISGTTGTTGTGTSYGTLNVVKGTTSSTVSWAPVTGAVLYQVAYKKANASTSTSSTVSTTTASVPCGASESWTVTVLALVNNQWIAVGSANVIPSTTVGGGTSTSINNQTVTTRGENCTVISTATSSTVQWNGTAGDSYKVIYVPEGTSGAEANVTYTTVTIPVGHSTNFYVYIISMSQGKVIASAYVQKSTTSSTTTPTTGTTTIKNLKLTPSTWNTAITWDKYTGAQYYKIDYSYIGALTGESWVTTDTNCTVPFGKNTDYTVTVYAVLTDGSVKTVGSATYYAKSATTSTPSVDVEVEETATEEFTGVWGETLGDGIVKISWNEVKGEDTYKVYYRKVGATKWSGGHKRTKNYISIDFGSKNADYEFKIEAGDEVSNIFVLNPSDDKGVCAFAHDGEADLSINLYGEVKDADNCKIKLTWDEVKGADGYKVYYREAGKTEWKGAWSRTSESITVTFKKESANKVYEIKIVADGDDSDIFTLKPAVWTNAD